MKILITGVSGFIGSNLSRFLLNKGHIVTGICRNNFANKPDGLTLIHADTATPGDWQENVADADAIINLSGQNIFHRWTLHYKKKIHDSRIFTTQNIVAALHEDSHQILINGSAIGYYGDRGDEQLFENANPGTDFLSRVCQHWEQQAIVGKSKGCRVVLARFGVVLGENGGALSHMSLPFKMFAGGQLGTGEQWFPWIHLLDLMSGIAFMLDSNISGPVNFCAPDQITNKNMSQALGKSLNRPCWLPTPAFMLRLILGEMSQCLLASQRIVPHQLNESGFIFKYQNIEKALSSIYTKE